MSQGRQRLRILPARRRRAYQLVLGLHAEEGTKIRRVGRVSQLSWLMLPWLF